MAVRADTSKRLGALLLQGWAMLAENCPDCQVPLMRDRSNEDRLCVNCDTTYLPGPDGGLRARAGGHGLPEAAVAPPQDSPNSTTAPRSSSGIGLAQRAADDEDRDEVYDPRSDPRLGPFASPAANGVATPSPAPSSATTAAAPAHPVPNGLPVAAGGQAPDGAAQQGSRQPTPDEVSNLLSTKMLQGWAMLDAYCPRCTTVLVRERPAPRRRFCVACCAFVVSEQDQLQASTAAGPPDAGSKPTAAASAPTAHGLPPAAATKPSPSAVALPQTATLSVPTPAAAAAAAAARAPAARGAAKTAVGPVASSKEVDLLASVGQTLLAKVSEAEQLLAHCSVEREPERCKAYVALLAECIALLPHLRQTGL